MDSYFSRKKTTESFKKINISKGQEKMQERNLHRQVEKNPEMEKNRQRRDAWTTTTTTLDDETTPGQKRIGPPKTQKFRGVTNEWKKYRFIEDDETEATPGHARVEELVGWVGWLVSDVKSCVSNR